MSDAIITATDRPPAAPDADFAFHIDFARGKGSPSRIFRATSEFIRACERLDHELVRSVDSSIEAVLVLEDVEASSLKTWLRTTLRATDDQALKDLDWKPLIGKYLVRAKYLALKWVDDESERPRSLQDLREGIRELAAETDVRQLPDYAPPSPDALIDAVRGFQNVKDALTTDDRATYITPDSGSIELNLSVRIDVDEIEQLAIARTIEQPVARMILAVKKPDYLGRSQWEFRLGKRSFTASVLDEEWLRRFQGRQVDVRPGDALECDVQVVYVYGYDNELLRERLAVIQVHDVLQDRWVQGDLLDGE